MTLDELQTRLREIQDWLQEAYTGIRTGQASPAILDSVRVAAYGSALPIKQVASIGIEDARTLRVTPWDKQMIGAIERAIAEADLGVSAVVDEAGLRVIFPELTSERRAQLIKLAKAKLEEARVSVRGARDHAIKAADAAEKNGEMSEDEKFAQKERVQTHIDQANAQLEALYAQKEAEIST